MKDMERWAKIQNRQKESVRAPSPVLRSGAEEKKASKAADAAFAVFERKVRQLFVCFVCFIPCLQKSISISEIFHLCFYENPCVPW